MDVSSTSAVAGYASAMSGSKSATDVGIAMLNKSLDNQAKTAEQLIGSVTETSQSLQDHLGQTINVTA
ncbi:YjfB family protein [Thiocystis violacea]|uniref:YjfB family protein n=1 Tax=Thiocystis violacea TaxID=13725 RepID=UPI0019065055|nr:YjfB family protein [Thiocystis violacea]MBK1717769.1 hypothetical protein [Thiocystis violacea]